MFLCSIIYLFTKFKRGKVMNIKLTTYDYDILKAICFTTNPTQRMLADECNCSLGKINKSLAKLKEYGYIDSNLNLTKISNDIIKKHRPKRAIILAAGFGMRMAPINSEIPKGLIEIHGEPLIERTIKQLNEVGISEIYVIVGFMKEMYDYLVDKYNIKLIVNTEYTTKNNLYSLSLASKYLSNSYIIPCDIWFRNNPYSKYEPYSWYMVSNNNTNDSNVRINRNKELVTVSHPQQGNKMIGVCYLNENISSQISENMSILLENAGNDNLFWEESLFNKGKMIVKGRIIRTSEAFEINTYEELRELDSNSNQLNSDAIKTIESILSCNSSEIKNIQILKKGMTNRSFLFECKNQKYIMRIPGQGTDNLINRKQEAEVYSSISKINICDAPVYINPENGYKITRFLENVRSCNSDDVNDLTKCMELLRKFHNAKLTVRHEFNIFEKIEFYESLWEGQPSVYRDYQNVKMNVLSLKNFIDKHKSEYVLTHIDAISDNFLFYKNDSDSEEKLQLTDWEYSGMQDPHVDIAMFCIYSLYDKSQIDRLIDIYFEGKCTEITRIKIYCYIATCGLLWSNWCEYKRNLGIDFGEYSLRQYRYAKDYYKIVSSEIKKLQGDGDV